MTEYEESEESKEILRFLDEIDASIMQEEEGPIFVRERPNRRRECGMLPSFALPVWRMGKRSKGREFFKPEDEGDKYHYFDANKQNNIFIEEENIAEVFTRHQELKKEIKNMTLEQKRKFLQPFFEIGEKELKEVRNYIQELDVELIPIFDNLWVNGDQSRETILMNIKGESLGETENHFCKFKKLCLGDFWRRK